MTSDTPQPDDLLEWIENEASRGMADGDTRDALNAIKWKIKDYKAALTAPALTGKDGTNG